MVPLVKEYDRAYFDRWYRGRRKVGTSSELARQAAFVVAAAEVVLARPIRSVLDVGCGYGDLLGHVRPSVTSIDLVDASPLREERAIARAKERGLPARFVLCDVNGPCTALPPGPYDTVVMGALLEHLRPPIRILAAAAALLGPKGLLVLTTPTPLGGELHRLGSHVGLTHPEAAHEHFGFYGRRELEQLLAEGSLEMVSYSRFLFGLNQIVVARRAASRR